MPQLLTNLFSDPVTTMIIAATIGCFLFFFIREWLTTNKEIRRLELISSISNRNSSAILKADALTSEELVWVTDHLVY
ncbi:chemotaxis protein, partial [Vibrio parahaemolyticus]